jgi:hypothetical protein
MIERDQDRRNRMLVAEAVEPCFDRHSLRHVAHSETSLAGAPLLSQHHARTVNHSRAERREASGQWARRLLGARASRPSRPGAVRRLYREGLPTGDFEPAFRELVGETMALSPRAIVRLRSAGPRSRQLASAPIGGCGLPVQEALERAGSDGRELESATLGVGESGAPLLFFKRPAD